MMYSLIDVENQANSLNQRKGIMDHLEECITHTFYANEPDATKYYMDRVSRKKQLGGKYNEKFFLNVKNEGDEFEEEDNAGEDATYGGED